MSKINEHYPQQDTQEARITARDIWSAIQRTSAATLQIAANVRASQEDEDGARTMVRVQIPCHLYLSVESEDDLADAIFRLFGPHHVMEPIGALNDATWPSVQIGDVVNTAALDLDSTDMMADRTKEWWRDA